MSVFSQEGNAKTEFRFSKLMIPDQINIAIAKELGWKHDHSSDYDAFYRPDGTYSGGATHDLKRAVENAGIHNFHGSLDSCAQFEATLTDWEAAVGYPNALAGVLQANDTKGIRVSYIQWIRATAPLRCEAFLRTRGKWV